MSLCIYGIGASRAMRPLWAALELGLHFEHQSVSFLGGATHTLEFLALNPNGHIPVLVDTTNAAQPVTVWESMACTLYLTQVHGRADNNNIVPASPREEAEALRWSFLAVTTLEKDALTVLMHRLAMPQEQRKPELAEQASRRLQVPLAIVEAHLQTQNDQGQAYLAANRFTVADLCLASVAFWLRPAPELLAAFPRVSNWLQSCIDRPAHQQARNMK